MAALLLVLLLATPFDEALARADRLAAAARAAGDEDRDAALARALAAYRITSYNVCYTKLLRLYLQPQQHQVHGKEWGHK